MIAICATIMLLQAPQETPPPASAEKLLERYHRLDRDQRNTVVRNMERRLRRVNDDVLQRIAGFERGLASYPALAEPKWYLPKDYAPVARKRQLIATGSIAHTKATARMTTNSGAPNIVNRNRSMMMGTIALMVSTVSRRFASRRNIAAPLCRRISE